MNRPWVEGNSVQLLINGEQYYPRVFEAMAKAREEILLETFIISSGKKGTPTVTGTFRIYVKYSSAPMSGPGYYLPGVPYVMYFYKDYGLHGTYWHNNFGTPMSHGCVNLKTENHGASE